MQKTFQPTKIIGGDFPKKEPFIKSFCDKRDKFTQKVIKSIENMKNADKLTKKELADFMIMNIVTKFDLGSESQAVLDRVIMILQEDGESCKCR